MKTHSGTFCSTPAHRASSALHTGPLLLKISMQNHHLRCLQQGNNNLRWQDFFFWSGKSKFFFSGETVIFECDSLFRSPILFSHLSCHSRSVWSNEAGISKNDLKNRNKILRLILFYQRPSLSLLWHPGSLKHIATSHTEAERLCDPFRVLKGILIVWESLELFTVKLSGVRWKEKETKSCIN